MSNMKPIREEYEKMVAEIESAKIFDGRGKGVDVYCCEECGEEFYTRYADKGVTPFTILCRHCGHGTAMHVKTISEQRATIIAVLGGAKIHNWVRPTFEQLCKVDKGYVEHVLNGGLMLEDEL